EYAYVSGYKINMGKSVALPHGMDPRAIEGLRTAHTFTIAKTNIKYLGVRLTADPDKLYSENYTPRIQSLYRDIEK
ncbi:Hypothetical predicted protein, partial [Pelobates cultripes]